MRNAICRIPPDVSPVRVRRNHVSTTTVRGRNGLCCRTAPPSFAFIIDFSTEYLLVCTHRTNLFCVCQCVSVSQTFYCMAATHATATATAANGRGAQPGGKRKLDSANNDVVHSPQNKKIAQEDGDEREQEKEMRRKTMQKEKEEEKRLRRWVEQEFTTADDTQPDDADDLRARIRTLPLRVFADKIQTVTFNPSTLHFINHLTVLPDGKDVSVNEFCRFWFFWESDLLSITSVLALAEELALYLRLAACLGITFHGFKIPAIYSTHHHGLHVDDVVVIALLSAGTD